jgi:multidrug efflux pump subunit AcrA (membrane-fusion protein)
MTTDSTPMLSDDDRAIALADQRAKADQQAHEAARAVRETFGFEEAGRSARIRLRVLEADCAAEETGPRLAESRKIAEVARYQRDIRLRAAYRDRSRPRRRDALTQARALAEALQGDLVDRDALAAALGVAAGSGGHPCANAAALVAALEYFCRELDPPPPPPPAPVPAGCVRVKTLVRHWNHAARFGLAFDVGDEYVIPVEQVADATAERLVEVLAE